MEMKAQLKTLQSITQDIFNTTDRLQKRQRYERILKYIDGIIPEIINQFQTQIQSFERWGFNSWLDLQNNNHYGIDVNTQFLIDFVDREFANIVIWENESEEQKNERKLKSYQLRQHNMSKEKVVNRIITNSLLSHEEKEENPDWQYSKFGTYTKYLKFKQQKYFYLCLSIKETNCSEFNATNRLVLLYAAVNNELIKINAELNIIGFDTADTKPQQPEPKTDEAKTQRQINVNKLKTYLTADIFIKKGKQRSKADELINMLKAERTNIEIAEIAMFAQTLLQQQYKHSTDWNSWLPIFYQIAGVENGYNYRKTEIKNGNLSQQLTGLFDSKKKPQITKQQPQI